MMPLRELSTITFPHVKNAQPFCLQQTNTKNNEFCVLTQSSGHILQLYGNSDENDQINLHQTIYTPFNTIATKQFNVIAKDVYNKANDLEKQQLCLDQMLLPDIIPTPSTITLLASKLSPSYGSAASTKYLLGLSSTGCCDIKIKPNRNAEWSITVADVTKLWLDYYQNVTNIQFNNIVKFAELQKAVDDIHIYSVGWNNFITNNVYSFGGITVSGKFIVFTLEEKGPTNQALVKVQNMFDLGLYKINRFQWISYEIDNTTELRSYLCTSDLLGNITLFRVIFMDGIVNDVLLVLKLWNHSDHIIVNEIQMEYDSITQRLIIVICKLLHVVVFFVDEAPPPTLIHTAVHMVNGLAVSGFCRLNPMKYAISTLDGQFQCLTINNTAKSIESEEIKTNLNLSKHRVLGLDVSNNMAIWLIALFPSLPTDHLVLRNPFTVAVCSFSTENIITILEQQCPTKSIKDYLDCAESLRISQIRFNDIPLSHIHPLIEEIIFNDPTMIYQLKIMLVFLNAQSAYFRKICRLSDVHSIQLEYELIKKTILVINYNTRLQTILNQSTPKTLNKFQLLSIKCLATFLQNYMDGNFLEKYNIWHDSIRPNIQSICSELAEWEAEPESCSYCYEPIELNQMQCKHQHDIQRCCITMVQVPLVNTRRCYFCQAVALDDVCKLQEATFTQNELFYCPICDVPLECL